MQFQNMRILACFKWISIWRDGTNSGPTLKCFIEVKHASRPKPYLSIPKTIQDGTISGPILKYYIHLKQASIQLFVNEDGSKV